MKRLLIRRMSVEAIPPGGGLASGIDFLLSGKFATGARSALVWCDEAVRVVQSAAEPNPFKDKDEEYIAGELLARLQKRETKA